MDVVITVTTEARDCLLPHSLTGAEQVREAMAEVESTLLDEALKAEVP